MSEFLLYGGKGGVGKTTCAAATGVALADRGERVLVVSTDPAHSLGDVFETRVGPDPVELDSNLWGVEPSSEAGQRIYRGIVESIAAEFRSAGIRFEDEDVERLFAAGIVPGSDELASLQLFGRFTEDSSEWDRVVFDTAPTGHTLRLLSLPDVLSESLSTVVKVRGEVHRLVDSARSLVFGPAAYFGRRDEPDEVDELAADMDRVAAMLRDPERTEFRVVLVPERLPIEETRRLVEELRSLHVPVQTLVVNRVLEDVDETCARCRARKELHDRRLDSIRETFPDLSIQVLPELTGEASGRQSLDELAHRIDV